jgi:hypothetical protein
MNGFLTSDFTAIGKTGNEIDIGKGREPGASSAINPSRKSSGRS